MGSEPRDTFLAKSFPLHWCANPTPASAALLRPFHSLGRLPLALTLLCYFLAFSAAGEESKVVLGDIHWDGTLALTSRELEDRMISRGASWKPWVSNPSFDELLLQEDLERIRDFYRASGYYDAEVEYTLEWKRLERG